MADVFAPSGVLNTYGELGELKRRLGVTGTGSDVSLWMALNAASRVVEGYCNRRFYTLLATRVFDVADGGGFASPDLIRVLSFREDVHGDRMFEFVRGAEDYVLHPSNADPESAWGRPFSRVAADPRGSRPRFTTGRCRVRIEGLWGYRLHVARPGLELDGGGSALRESTTLEVVDGSLAAGGQTLQVEAEQVFVRGVSGNSLTVVRGVNGTSAAAHPGSTALGVHVYPAGAVEATLVLAGHTWKGKDAAYGSLGLGGSRIFPGGDSDLSVLLSELRRLGV